MSSRRLLGYHVDPSTKTCLVYSRDAAAGPLRELDGVLSQIREKKFEPDNTRSGHFRTIREDQLQSQEDDGEQSSEVSASDTEDSEDEEPSEEHQKALEEAADDVVGEWCEHSTLEEESDVWKQSPHFFRTRILDIFMFVLMRRKCISDVDERLRQAMRNLKRGQSSLRLNAVSVSSSSRPWQQKNA